MNDFVPVTKSQSLQDLNCELSDQVLGQALKLVQFYELVQVDAEKFEDQNHVFSE